MKLSEILKDLTILDTNADLNADIADVCYDSRQAKPGSLFVAITGAETDGHKYIPMARDKGAACVVCQHAPETDIPYVVVEDSRHATPMDQPEIFNTTLLGFLADIDKTKEQPCSNVS